MQVWPYTGKAIQSTVKGGQGEGQGAHLASEQLEKVKEDAVDIFCLFIYPLSLFIALFNRGP